MNGSGGSSGSSGSSGSAGSAGVTSDADCTPTFAASSQIARLTASQYDRTIRDLVGVTGLSNSANAAPSSLLATDQAGGLTDLGWSAYQSVAAQIATQVMADPALKAKFLKCDPALVNCLHDTVVEFGRRAFRRPLTAAELSSFDAIIAKGATLTPTGAPAEVAGALLYMFLISPSFLQRSEITETPDSAGRFTLSNHEVASRLSYMLWGSTPDTALDQAADAGQLSTPEQIKAQADRMLADPKAREMVVGFHRYYLHMGFNTRWDSARHDPALFPAFTADVVPAMVTETEMFFDNVVFGQKGGFKDLLLSTKAYVNAATAPLYGVKGTFGADLTEVSLEPTQRPGFLTRLGFLNAYSQYSRSSPILRGAFITKHVMGLELGSPPPGAEATALPMGADLDTNRKQVQAQTAGATCAGCHHPYINPPGFVMDSFNAIGAWQTAEAATGVPLDTTADVIVDASDVPIHVTNPGELMTAIAGSASAARYYAARWVSYAYERESDPLDSCTVNKLAAKMTASGYSVLNLISDLTQAQSFRLRTLDSGVAQ